MINKNLKKVLSMVLVLMLTCSSVVFAKSNDYGGHWAEKSIQTWIEKGYVKGYADGTFKPENDITRAEFITIVNRTFGFTAEAEVTYKDVKKSHWAYDEFKRASAEGYIAGFEDGTLRPNDQITRQEVAAIIARLLNLAKAQDSDAFLGLEDLKDVPEWSAGAVSALVDKGFIRLRDGNLFAPKLPATRAEVVDVLNKGLSSVVKVHYNKAGTYTEGVVDGSVAINAKDVILKDTIISGNLIIGEDVGDGEVTLENVVVEGDTIVKGGGMKSIIVVDSKMKNLIIEKKDGKVRILAKGSTYIDNVDMKSGGKLESSSKETENFGYVVVAKDILSNEPIILAGNFINVEVRTGINEIKVQSGTIKNLAIATTAKNAKVNLADGVKVDSVAVNASVTIDGKGKIGTATVNVNDVKITAPTDKITEATGVDKVKQTEPSKPSQSGSSESEPSQAELLAVALKAINNGTATQAQYTRAGITGVTAENLETVNEMVKKEAADGALNTAVIQEVVDYVVAIEGYNKVFARVKDLTVVEIGAKFKVDGDTIVIREDETQYGSGTDEFFMEISDARALKLALDLEGDLSIENILKKDIQVGQIIVNKIVNGGGHPGVVAAIKTINTGKATLVEYNMAGIISVRPGNLNVINAAVLKAVAVKKANLDLNEILVVILNFYKQESVVAALKTINTGKALLIDYATVGLEGVTPENIAAINTAVLRATEEKKGALNLSQIEVVIFDICAQELRVVILKAINEGTAKVLDYGNVGIEGVTAENLETVNLLVKTEAADGALDTVAIQVVVDYVVALEGFNKVSVRVTDLTVVEIGAKFKVDGDIIVIREDGTQYGSGPDKFFMEISDARALKLALSLKEDLKLESLIQKEIQIGTIIENKIFNGGGHPGVVAAILRINKGTATLEDYSMAGIEGVTSENLANVKKAVSRAVFDNKGNHLNQSDILMVVFDIVVEELVAMALETINTGRGSLDDYELVDIIGVTEDNLSKVNSEVIAKALVEQRVLTEEEIQIVVFGVLAVEVGDYLEYYKALENFNNASARVKNLEAVAAGTSFIVDSSKTVMIRPDNATPQNVGDRYYMKISDAKALKSALALGENSDVKITLCIENISVNTEIITSILDNKIYEGGGYAAVAGLALEKINKGIATLNEYEILGIIGVTEDNLETVNATVKEAAANGALNETAIQEVVDYVEALENFNNASARVESLEAVAAGTSFVVNGITVMIRPDDATPQNVGDRYYIRISDAEELKKALEFTGSEDVKALTEKTEKITDVLWGEIHEGGGYAAALEVALDTINTGTGSLDDYTVADIIGVTEKNLDTVNVALETERSAKQRGLNAEEIQIIVFGFLAEELVAVTLKVINEGSASLADYKIVGIEGVTEENLEKVNIFVKSEADSAAKKFDKAAIQKIVDYFVALEDFDNASDRIEDLEEIGDGISFIVDSKTVMIRPDDAKPTSVGDQYYITVSDATALKEALYFVLNPDIEGALSTQSLIDNTEKITVILWEKIYEGGGYAAVVEAALAKINTGDATLDDYTVVEIIGVTLENIAEVNQLVKEVIKIVGQINQENIKQIFFEIFGEVSLQAIYAGTATVADYERAVISGVTAETIDRVNEQIQFILSVPDVELDEDEIQEIAYYFEALQNFDNAFARVEWGGVTTGSGISFDITTGQSISLDHIDVEIRDDEGNATKLAYKFYMKISDAKELVLALYLTDKPDDKILLTTKNLREKTNKIIEILTTKIFEDESFESN